LERHAMYGRLPRGRAIALASLLSLVALLALVVGTAAAKPLPAKDRQFVDGVVAKAMKEERLPGVSVTVSGPKGNYTRAYGVGDRATGTPLKVADHVRIASITKTFTGTVVLQLVDDGKLALDDRLASFVPGIANGPQITIRQLLNMTAGVFDYTTDPGFAPAYQADPALAFAPAQALALIRQHPAAFAPGTQVRYSNSNTYLLGLIIEQVTGQRAGAAIRERIIAPLGLSGTSFPTTPELPTPYAHGYDAAAPGDPLRDVTRSNPAVPWTAGAMVSTLADLRAWAGALAHGTLLSPALQRARPHGNPMPGSRPGLDLRYGLGLLTLNGLIGHSGGIAGYGAWMLHDPDADATLVLVVTRTEAADPLLAGLLPLVFPQRFPSALATPAAATAVSQLPA
jgi:D-alanyl-D-alanine carboxypeptidase